MCNFNPLNLQLADGVSRPEDFRQWRAENGRCIQSRLHFVCHYADTGLRHSELDHVILDRNSDQPLCAATAVHSRDGTLVQSSARYLCDYLSLVIRFCTSNHCVYRSNSKSDREDYFREYEHLKVKNKW